jgi:beta-lactamase superfamily II metal-dependent hydrolase
VGIFHFLNVGQGDCSIIQHPSGHVTVVDVNHAKPPLTEGAKLIISIMKENYAQKSNPTNPIEYMQERGINDVFRFVLSHPDMDHMGGIKALFEAFAPANFWDTANNCVKDDWNGGPYSRDDWDFYRSIRDGRNVSTKRLVLYAGARGKYYNDDDAAGGGDGLHILAPTPALVSAANGNGDHNDCSYVILYRSRAGRILLAGDSHDATWRHILDNHADEVADVEVLLAPHHGRHSDRDFSFLDVVRPKLTLFGNASSEHLAYAAWSYRKLPIITNNQAGDVIIDTGGPQMQLFVTNEKYARATNPHTGYDQRLRGYYIGSLTAPAPRAFSNALGGLR